MKKTAFIILSLLLSLSLFPAYAAEDVEKVTEVEIKVNVVSDKFPQSGDSEISFIYDDAYFLSDPSELSLSMAKASICLSSVVSSQTEVSSIFRKMGYKVIGKFNYDRIYTTEDCGYTAYTVARKEAIFADGSIYWLYIVAIRGTTGMEWFSNFDIGHGGDHAGFTLAADDIMASLGSLVDTPKEKSKILVTGHSRGGAAANLVSHRLMTDETLFLKENVFGYTFACPNVTRTPSEDDAIFNFNNPGDLVPFMPLPGWGFARHGKDIVFPADERTLASLDAEMISKSGSPYTGTSDFSKFENLALEWCPTVDNFYKPGTLVPSPSEIFGIVAGCLTDGNISRILELVPSLMLAEDAWAVASYLYDNMSNIGVGHSPLTYICWMNAAYPSDFSKISVVPYNGEYDGKPHAICSLSGKSENAAVSYSFDGRNWTNAVPEATDAGVTEFYLRITENGSSMESGRLYSVITPKKIDVSDVKTNGGSFVYDGTPHSPRLPEKIPDGLTYTCGGDLSVTDVGTYVTYLEWKSDDPNYAPLDERTVLTWRITKASYDMKDAKWSYEKPFVRDGKEHAVSVVGLPDGVTPIYSGTYKASDVGKYTASVDFEYDDANYFLPMLGNLDWAIEEPDSSAAVIIASSAGGVLLAGAVTAAAVKKKKKKHE